MTEPALAHDLRCPAWVGAGCDDRDATGHTESESEMDQEMPTIRPAANTKLEALTAEYAGAKAEADKWADELKRITDAIKVEVLELAPDVDYITIESDYLPKPLVMDWVEQWGLDAKRMKKQDPVLYVQWATKRSFWRLGYQR